MLFASISAGEPVELDSALERVDLNEFFAGRSNSVLLLKINGNSMQDVPVFTGDWVMLDRLRRYESGNIVVARLGTGYTIKRLKTEDKRGKQHLYLVPANKNYAPMEIEEDDDAEILGVVTWIFHPTV